MTIQDITCFLKLAETLNYTKTAEELFISQPAVTRHINSLEDELGIKLFDRSVKRKIQLTEAGEIYQEGLKKCRDIYQDTLNAISNKALENPLIINLLRGIHIPDEYVDITNDFMISHPTFHHFTNFIDSSDIPGVLEKGEIVICQSEYLEKHSGYKSLQLTKNPVPHFIAASKNHAGFANLDTPDFSKIRDTALFLPKNLPTTLKEQYLSNLKKILDGDPNEIMYLDSMDSVDHFLRSGRCFTICSGWQALLDSKSIVSYEMNISSHYVALWDESKCVYPLAKEYLKTLKAIGI